MGYYPPAQSLGLGNFRRPRLHCSCSAHVTFVGLMSACLEQCLFG